MTLRLPDKPTTVTMENHKRDHDFFLENSSDPPMFSSDPPIFSTSIEDYQQPRRKRQHKGSWYETEGEGEQDLHMKTREDPDTRGARHQRRPLRKFDSGVYMGSDESLPSEFLESDSEHDVPGTTTNPVAFGATADGSMKDSDSDKGQMQQLTDPDALCEYSLLDRATQIVEDPGDFAGRVFPYWQQQPKGLRHFHIVQKIAQEKVLSCVDRGVEVIDLSTSNLTQIRTPTLRPLRLHIRQDRHPITNKPAKYKRFTPSLTLLLSNNLLTAVPGELYHLTNLNVLSLRGNAIGELLPAIGHLTSLKELNVGSNQLFYLPFELLSLLQGLLKNIMLYPNPFIKPVHPFGHEVSACKPLTLDAQRLRTSRTCDEFYHSASTWPAFLDITGNSMREYPPPPSQLPFHHPKLTAHTARPAIKSQQRVPSLVEIALRNLSYAPELSQLPFYIPARESPYLHTLLQRTYYLTESGGQKCTICGTNFIIPRTEWIEWWARPGGGPVPFLRRGCSWACFPNAEDEKVKKTGWRNGAGMELLG